MRRLNGIVLSIAILLAPATALAEPATSIIDRFEATGPLATFTLAPDLARFRTIGSPDSQTFNGVADETTAAITRVQAMMSELDTGWPEVIALRVLVTSEADRAQAAAVIAADPRLAALPVSYRLVDRLPAPRARVGLDVLARSTAAVEATARRYGPGAPTTR